MAAYDYLNQSIQSSLLVLPKDDDPFFNPVSLALTGYAFTGLLYDGGVLATAPFGQFQTLQASWFSEPQSSTRGILPSFPTAALCLLSQVAMTILDVSSPTANLPLWMQFIIQDQNALANNFNATLTGFTPSGLGYGGGIVVVTYTPDAGSQIQSSLAVNVDFVQDSVYLYAAH